MVTRNNQNMALNASLHCDPCSKIDDLQNRQKHVCEATGDFMPLGSAVKTFTGVFLPGNKHMSLCFPKRFASTVEWDASAKFGRRKYIRSVFS